MTDILSLAKRQLFGETPDLLQYRPGGHARVLCCDAPGDFPIITLATSGYTHHHRANGAHSVASDRSFDLIPVPAPAPEMPERIEVWVNRHPIGSASAYTSEMDANRKAAPDTTRYHGWLTRADLNAKELVDAASPKGKPIGYAQVRSDAALWWKIYPTVSAAVTDTLPSDWSIAALYPVTDTPPAAQPALTFEEFVEVVGECMRSCKTSPPIRPLYDALMSKLRGGGE